MSGLKRVEDQTKKISSSNDSDHCPADSKEGVEEAGLDKKTARNGSESISGERNSRDKKVGFYFIV